MKGEKAKAKSRMHVVMTLRAVGLGGVMWRGTVSSLRKTSKIMMKMMMMMMKKTRGASLPAYSLTTKARVAFTGAGLNYKIICEI